MTGIETNSLDHVALWVSNREPLTDLLCERLGMHVIEQHRDFTLVGGDAREGKLTLFAAEGPREPGVLGRIGLRVPDVDAGGRAAPGPAGRARRRARLFDGPEGIPLALVPRPRRRPSSTSTISSCGSPTRSRRCRGSRGSASSATETGCGWPTASVLRGAGAGRGRRAPAEPHRAARRLRPGGLAGGARARDRGDRDQGHRQHASPSSCADPEQIVIEYVEHKPTFSLT